LEIYSGDPNAGGTLVASNSDLFATTHTYTSADSGLSILANMPEGKYFVRGFDQAGNQATDVSFPIGSPSFLVGAQLRGVGQEAVRGGLKFSAEGLRYRQAGRQAFRADIKEGATGDSFGPLTAQSGQKQRSIDSIRFYRPLLASLRARDCKAHKLDVARPSRRLAKPPLRARSSRGLEPATFQFTPEGPRPRDPLAVVGVRPGLTRAPERGRCAGFSVRPSCLKILGGSLARACARGVPSLDRGVSNG
jgi:hypothetical protein